MEIQNIMSMIELPFRRSKKAFILLSVIILIFIFSILIIKVFEVKTISSINIINQYKYIQAKNHLNFLEEYIDSIKDLKAIDKILIENERFNIQALIKKINDPQEKYEIELIVSSIDFNIRVYKNKQITK